MDRIELKQKLEELHVPENAYSLYDELEDDRIIIYHNYSKWEVFYYERGGRNNMTIFHSESDACEYVLDLFIKEKQFYKDYDMVWYGINPKDL